MRNENPPAEFRNYCQAVIENDVLTVTCDIDGHHFEESMDFAPIAEVIAERLRVLHAAEHGDNISGLGDYLKKAVSAAKKVASAKTIKAVWNKVPGPVKEMVKSTVPGGAVAYSLAQKTYETVQKARSGDKSAIATIKATAKKALGGNQLAQQVMNTAKALNAAQNLKETENPTYLANRLAVLEGRLNPLIKTGATWPFKRKARKARVRNHRAMAPRGQFAAPRRPPVPPPLAPMEYGEGYEDIDSAAEESAEMVSGWFFNRPYRSPLAAAESSLALRYLYNEGLDTIRRRVR